jgi:hypothetical protein
MIGLEERTSELVYGETTPTTLKQLKVRRISSLSSERNEVIVELKNDFAHALRKSNALEEMLLFVQGGGYSMHILRQQTRSHLHTECRCEFPLIAVLRFS